MGRRTIAGHKLNFNKRRKPDELGCPADLAGERLQDLFADWAESLEDEGVIPVRGQSFLRVERVIRYGDSVVIVDTMSGKAGEEGAVYDSESGVHRFDLSESDVPTSGARAILFSPPRGDMALWFSEYSARSSGASLLLELFARQWRNFGNGYTFHKARLIAAEIALEDGLVSEVEVRLTRRADDRAVGIESKRGIVSHKFKPSRSHKLSGSLIDIFRRNPAKAYDLVEITAPGPDDESQIFVSVDVDGHSRKVEISNLDDGFYFREELNAGGEPVLTDVEIVGYCAKEARTFFERSGGEWDDAWARRD